MFAWTCGLMLALHLTDWLRDMWLWCSSRTDLLASLTLCVWCWCFMGLGGYDCWPVTLHLPGSYCAWSDQVDCMFAPVVWDWMIMTLGFWLWTCDHVGWACDVYDCCMACVQKAVCCANVLRAWMIYEYWLLALNSGKKNPRKTEENSWKHPKHQGVSLVQKENEYQNTEERKIRESPEP